MTTIESDEDPNALIEVYTIQTEEYGYTCVYSSVIAELEHLEEGDTLTVTKRTMTNKEFDALPEANI